MLWVSNMVRTKPLQSGDAEPPVATNDEWAGYLLAAGALSSGVLSTRRVNTGLSRQRGTLHTSFCVSLFEGFGMKL